MMVRKTMPTRLRGKALRARVEELTEELSALEKREQRLVGAEEMVRDLG